MPIKIFKRAGIYHYRGTVAGRRVRGSTHTAIKSIAQEIAARVETREWKRDLHGPEAVLTFADAATLYRAAGRPTRFLERIEDYWKDTLVKDIKPGLIRQMAIDLYPTQSGATRNRQGIIPCQAVINHAADSELCPRIQTKRFPSTRKIKKPADLEWVRTFMAHSSPHLGGLALFMFLTAARVSHALSVTWEDIDLKRKLVRLRETKVSKERFAHLPQELVVAIANIAKDRPTVFRYVTRESAQQEWSKVPARAGIERLSFHCCRHGFATTMLRRGVDVKTVMWLGGWEDANLFMKTYAHAINDATLTDRIIDTAWTQEVLENARNPMIAAVS